MGWTPPSDEEEVFKSEHFIYGRVRRTFKYEDPPYPWYDTLYVAEVDVYCIMKGLRTPATVNISQVGYIPGLCFSTELETDQTYAILTNVHEGKFVAQRTIPADDEKMQQLAQTCGLYTQYPSGLDESSSSVSCPASAPSEHCLDQVYFDSQRPPPRVPGNRPAAAAGRPLRLSSYLLRRNALNIRN
jgi:hypothetical protein